MTFTPSHILGLQQAVFRQEAEELLSELDSGLLALEAVPADMPSLHRVFRALHTLKGSGATAGFEDVTTVLHDVEDIFNGAREGRLTVTSAIVDSVLQIADVVRGMLRPGAQNTRELLAQGMELVAALKRLVPASALGTSSTNGAKPAPKAPSAAGSTGSDVGTGGHVWVIRFCPAARTFYSGNDPLLILRELLSLGHGVVLATTVARQGPDGAPEPFDPELCHLRWEVHLACDANLDQLREPFVFIEDECELEIVQRPAAEAAILPPQAYFDSEAIGDFHEECEEDIAQLESHALMLEEQSNLTAQLDGLRRTLHNLKGLSRLLLSDARRRPPPEHPLRIMGNLAHAAESFLSAEEQTADAGEWQAAVQTIFETVDMLKALHQAFLQGRDGRCAAALVERLGSEQESEDSWLQHTSNAPSAIVAISTQCREVLEGLAAPHTPDAEVSGNDRRALGRALQTLLQATRFHKDTRAEARIDFMLNACNAGISQVSAGSAVEATPQVRQAGDLAPPSLTWLHLHAMFRPIEELLNQPAEAPPDAPPPMVMTSVAPVSVGSRRAKSRTVSLRPSKAAAAGSANTGAAAGAQATVARTLRVDQSKLDRLMGAIGELLVAKNALPLLARRAESERHLARDLREVSDRIHHIAEDLQDAMRNVRMMPIRGLLQRLPRMIRDLARSVDKDVQLVIAGEDTELDKTVLEQLGDPLIHLVRNAVDHGLETPEERVGQGKPPMGTVGLEVLKEGSHIVVRISDDGRGMDPARLRAKVVEKGLLDEATAAALSDRAALELIFLPGLSTADKVTSISGRGVGMDVVQSNVRALHGTIDVSSVLGKGSTISIRLPASMMVSKGILLECAGEQYVLPIEGIREMVKLRYQDVRYFGDVAFAHVRGSIVPVYRLSDVLGLPAPPVTVDEPEEANAALVGTRRGEVGIIVDRLVTEIDVIVKPLSAGLDAMQLFQGATILGDGRVALILDPMKLDGIAGFDALGPRARPQLATGS